MVFPRNWYQNRDTFFSCALSLFFSFFFFSSSFCFFLLLLLLLLLLFFLMYIRVLGSIKKEERLDRNRKR